MKNKQEFLKALQELHQGNIPDRDVGICLNAVTVAKRLKSTEVYIELRNVFLVLFGEKNVPYPIEGSFHEYRNNTNKWDKSTDYGSMRYALLDLMIETVQKALGETK